MEEYIPHSLELVDCPECKGEGVDLAGVECTECKGDGEVSPYRHFYDGTEYEGFY